MLGIWKLNLEVRGPVTLSIGPQCDFSLEMPPHSGKHHQDLIAMWEFLTEEDILKDRLHRLRADPALPAGGLGKLACCKRWMGPEEREDGSFQYSPQRI